MPNVITGVSLCHTDQCYFILMGGFHLFDGERPVCVLLPKDVLQLFRDRQLVLPLTEEIEDSPSIIQRNHNPLDDTF